MRPWMRCSRIRASSSVFIFSVPAPSSLGPAMGNLGSGRAPRAAEKKTNEPALLHPLQLHVRPILAPRLRLRAAVQLDHVGGEVPTALVRARPHAIGVHRNPV